MVCLVGDEGAFSCPKGVDEVTSLRILDAGMSLRGRGGEGLGHERDGVNVISTLLNYIAPSVSFHRPSLCSPFLVLSVLPDNIVRPVGVNATDNCSPPELR